MDTVQNPAAEKLYKKLTALRVTLPNDEREVFDQIIPAEDEVTAHRAISVKPAAKKRAKKAPEVTGHKLTTGKAKKTSVRKAKKAAVK